MADLSITATAVVPGEAADLQTYIAGATIAAGKSVYLDTDGTVKLAVANGTATSRRPLGIAVNGASAGQPVEVQRGGRLTVNAVLTKGVAYYQSRTAGGIAPFADLVTGDFPTLLGIAQSTTVLDVVVREAGSAI
ncbi:hypothetical protein ACLBKU_12015 [Erythrobacter sp. NE805]|uniref:hypothetical protein n=1 Tax=Erythrobacter sp. NE805 TaxID=3389875 RepID=UPI00396B3512